MYSISHEDEGDGLTTIRENLSEEKVVAFLSEQNSLAYQYIVFDHGDEIDDYGLTEILDFERGDEWLENHRAKHNILLPPEIEERLARGAHLVVSVSGGKDSDVMALELHKLHTERGYTGDFVMIHADLGRMEWPQSKPHCWQLADRLRCRLVAVHHAKYDLLEGIRQRHLKRPDAPPFPSSAARYCTSDWKRGPIDKWLRNAYPENADVVMAIGLRREESSGRAKKPVWQARPKASAPTKEREVVDWYPLLDYTLDEVFQTAADYDWELHPAYALGNARVSCALCVLACQGDLRNGAEHNPGLYRDLVDIELESGYAFQQGKPLSNLRPDLLTEEQRQSLAAQRSGKPVQQKMILVA